MEKVASYIIKGELKKAITNLKQKGSGIDKNELAHLESRLSSIDNFYNSGVISLQEYSLEKNKISKALLAIIDGNEKENIQDKKNRVDMFLLSNRTLILISIINLLVLAILHSPYIVVDVDGNLDYISSHFGFYYAASGNEMVKLYILFALSVVLIFISRIWTLILFATIQMIIFFFVAKQLSTYVFLSEIFKINWGVYLALILWTIMMTFTGILIRQKISKNKNY